MTIQIFCNVCKKQSEHVITILIRKNLIFNCSWLSYWIEGGWARLSKIGSSQRELQQIRRNVHIDKFFGSHWALNTVHQLNPYRYWYLNIWKGGLRARVHHTFSGLQDALKVMWVSEWVDFSYLDWCEDDEDEDVWW